MYMMRCILNTRTAIKLAALCSIIVSTTNFYIVQNASNQRNSSPPGTTFILDDDLKEPGGEAGENTTTSDLTSKYLVHEDANESFKNERTSSEQVLVVSSSSNSPPLVVVYDAAEYERKLQDALMPLPEAKTAFHARQFIAGLCNQYIRFIGVSMIARSNGFDQIIEESINWKDTFGTDTFVRHNKLWDLVHWNSFYPDLPRFIRYEKDTHTDLKAYPLDKLTIAPGEEYDNIDVRYDVPDGHDIWNKSLSTYPPPIGQFPNQSFNKFKQLSKRIEYGQAQPEDLDLKIYEIMLKGALRPHPFLQAIIDQTASNLGGDDGQGYMVIHMRVEPDMLQQRTCVNKKVWHVDNITDMVYKQFPEPPVKTVLIVFARALIETMEAHTKAKETRSEIEVVNRHNLDSIQDLLENGMWGGKVKVVEAGSAMVEAGGDPFYKYYSNIAGGIVNFFLAIQSKILVGTEVSTWSTLSMNSRYYRDMKENYFYTPDGLHWVTPPNATKPHRFYC